MNPLPQLVFTVNEAVEITKLSRTTLWKAVKRGWLKPCSIGTRRVLFTLKALEDFLSQQRSPVRREGSRRVRA